MITSRLFVVFNYESFKRIKFLISIMFFISRDLSLELNPYETSYIVSDKTE